MRGKCKKHKKVNWKHFSNIAAHKTILCLRPGFLPKLLIFALVVNDGVVSKSVGGTTLWHNLQLTVSRIVRTFIPKYLCHRNRPSFRYKLLDLSWLTRVLSGLTPFSVMLTLSSMYVCVALTKISCLHLGCTKEYKVLSKRHILYNTVYHFPSYLTLHNLSIC